MTEIDIELVDNNEPIEIEVEDVIQTGGGGGTTNYNLLTHKPQINGVTLSGNKTLEELGITESIGTEVETYVEEHKAELKGEKGDSIKGDKGDDGFSPVTSVRRVSNGVEISITDKTHTDTQTVYDGEGGSGSAVWGSIGGNISQQTDLQTALNNKANTSDIPSLSGYATENYVKAYHDSTKQDKLVSGTNIKSVNGTSLLGSGNIAIPKGDKGDKGDDGNDYVITEADYDAIANLVLLKLPIAESVNV